MKKTIFAICAMLLAGMLAVSLTSCVNTSLEEEDAPQNISKLVFKGKLSYGSDIDTKVVKTGWKSGDKVYAFFKVGENHLDAAKYVELSYTGGNPAWEATASAALTDLNDLGTAGTMYVVFFPFGTITPTTDNDGGVTFDAVYSYYMCGSADYTVTMSGENAILASTVEVNIPEDYVYFFVDKSGSDFNADDTYFLTADGFQPVACTSFKNGTFTETTKTVGDPVWGYAYDGAGIAFSGKIDDSWKGTNSHNIILYTGAQPYPLKYMIKTAALTSHASVNLKNGWTECGFRGYHVSQGLLTYDETNGYGFTTGTDPFSEYSNSSYSYKWSVVKNQNTGWIFPSRAESNDIWGAIINNTPKTPIRINNSGTLTKLNANAYALISVGTNQGILLIRDGAIIDNVINNFGGANNTLTQTQLEKLVAQGCVIIPTGNYWLSDGTDNQHKFLKIEVENDALSFGQGSGNKNAKHAAHLVKAI